MTEPATGKSGHQDLEKEKINKKKRNKLVLTENSAIMDCLGKAASEREAPKVIHNPLRGSDSGEKRRAQASPRTA